MTMVMTSKELRSARQRFGGETPERLAELIADETVADNVMNGMQCAAALLFGDRRGWRLSTTTFGLLSLAAGQERDEPGEDCTGRDGFDGDICGCFDHAYWYRRDGHPAAIAAHLYNGEQMRLRCLAVARHFGLQFETPDFPSWWAPGRTMLVAYVGPAGSAL
jgi:hypothetical protein